MQQTKEELLDKVKATSFKINIKSKIQAFAKLLLEKLKKIAFETNIFLAIFTIGVFFSSPIYSTYAKSYIDESLKNAVVTYATLRSLNAGVSVIQESSISLSVGVGGDIAIGQALDPINDAIERFSDMVTLSIWTLGAQKALYEVSNTNAIYYLVILLAISSIFVRHKILTKLLIVLIVLRLFIPFSAITSSYFNEQLFNPQIEKNLKVIQNLTQAPVELKTQTSSSAWSAITDSVNQAKETLSEFMGSVKFYVTNAPKIMATLIELSTLYLGKYILNLLLLPLFFVYIIRSLIEDKR